MTGNRVEELETKVRELEATVNGLTDELVEAKERLHTIEAELDVEPEILDGESTGGSWESTPESDGTDPTSSDDVNSEGGEEEDEAGSSDDIIVA